MRQRLDELSRAGGEVLVISFDAPERIESFQRALDLPMTIAADPDRTAYDAYGLRRGSFWKVWHPRVLWRYVKLVRAGMKLRRPKRGEDLSQLGGDFVIGPDRELRFVHVSRSPDDRPAATVLVDAVRG